MSDAQNSIDTSFEIVTPENIAFQYRIAGPFRRYGAWLIDTILTMLCLILFSITMQIFDFTTQTSFGTALLQIIMFVMFWFVMGMFEMSWNGQTPGKRLTGLRVVGTNGQPINAWQAFLRNILRLIDLMPLIPMQYINGILPDEIITERFYNVPIPTGIVGLMACFCSSRFQRLGDLASNTMVIVEERPYVIGLAMLKDVAARQAAADLPLDLRISRRTAKALAKYVERRQVFTPQRRAELARRLGAPLRERYLIPKAMDDDKLLCGLYYRTFIGQNNQDEPAKSDPGAFPKLP